MKALFISDLHLEESRTDISDTFFAFVKEKILALDDIEQFYILGDFFEVWIGDDFKNPFVDSIKNCLKEISQKIPQCFFQHGNRDFLIGEQFAKDTGFNILGDVATVPHPALNIIVMHGDSLCTLDTKYLQMRSFLRSELFIKDVMSKSIEDRLALAKQMRAASKDANSGKAMDIMDVTPEEVIKIMEEYHADILIHGHTHRPKVHSVATAHNKSAQRMVMSDWENKIQYVELDLQGARLLSFNS